MKWEEKITEALSTWKLSNGDCRAQFPEGESALHYGPRPIEGILIPWKQILQFLPVEDIYPVLPLGFELRLSFPGGSAWVIVLQRAERGFILAPTPVRKERRRTPRMVASGFALIGREGDPEPLLKAEICDLSAGGIGLLSPEPLEGNRYQMFFQVMGGLLLKGECPAQVISCRQARRGKKGLWRIGFEFMTLPETLRAQIEQMTLPPPQP